MNTIDNEDIDNSPRLLNIHTDKIPKGAVYLGRPGKWGNPYIIGRDGNREEVVAKYEKWLSGFEAESLRKAAVKELKGKVLFCHCVPLKCHGAVLIKLANSL